MGGGDGGGFGGGSGSGRLMFSGQGKGGCQTAATPAGGSEGIKTPSAAYSDLQHVGERDVDSVVGDDTAGRRRITRREETTLQGAATTPAGVQQAPNWRGNYASALASMPAHMRLLLPTATTAHHCCCKLPVAKGVHLAVLMGSPCTGLIICMK